MGLMAKAVDLTNDSFTINNSALDFDGWDDLTVFATLSNKL